MAHTPRFRLWFITGIVALVGLPQMVASNIEGFRAPTPSVEEMALVEFALSRFEAQGLVLPEVHFVFHDSLHPCHGHKGMYHQASRTLELCKLEKATILHELAHAWANENLTDEDMDAFVTWRGLESWNDHEHPWARRGTEHVAETIAWALLDTPNHVRWVETLTDGTQETTHRILTLHVDIETLLENFEVITGQEPLFRHPGEWDSDHAPRAVEASDFYFLAQR